MLPSPRRAAPQIARRWVASIAGAGKTAIRALAFSSGGLILAQCAPAALDEHHGLQWKAQFPVDGHGFFSGAAAAAPNRYFLVGRAGTASNRQRAALFELSADGKISLRDPLTPEPRRHYTHIFPTGSGGFVIVSESSDTPRQDRIALTEIDSTGTYLRESQSEAIADPALRAAKRSESGLVSVLTTSGLTPGAPTLSYIDEWDEKALQNRPKRISFEHPDSVEFTDLIREDAEYLLLGFHRNLSENSAETKLYRIGLDGSLRAIHPIARGSGARLIRDGAAGYWIVGWQYRAAIWRVTQSGRIKSERTYDCDGFSVAEADSDGLFAAGILDRSESTTDVCLYRIDARHRTIWSRTLASAPRNERTYLYWLRPEIDQGRLLGGGYSEISNARFVGFAFAAALE